MRVYVYSPPGGVYVVRPKDESLATFQKLDFIDKREVKEWVPVPVFLDRHDSYRSEKRQPADFPTPNFGSLVLNKRGKLTLQSYLAHYGQLLPLDCAETSLWALNVTNIVDALDLDKSEILDRDSMDPMCPNAVGFAFKPDRLVGVDVFRIPQVNLTQTFFTDAFVAEIKKHGLTGFGSRRVWSDE